MKSSSSIRPIRRGECFASLIWGDGEEALWGVKEKYVTELSTKYTVFFKTKSHFENAPLNSYSFLMVAQKRMIRERCQEVRALRMCLVLLFRICGSNNPGSQDLGLYQSFNTTKTSPLTLIMLLLFYIRVTKYSACCWIVSHLSHFLHLYYIVLITIAL